LFHPQAISTLVQYAVNNKVFSETDVFLHNEIWSSFHAHSDLNELEQEDIINALNQKISNFRNDIEQVSHFIVTLGTAWVYRLIETNEVVANCHKIPQQKFQKELLSIDDCQQAIFQIEAGLRQINPNIQII